jgi:hypothetical protein
MVMLVTMLVVGVRSCWKLKPSSRLKVSFAPSPSTREVPLCGYDHRSRGVIRAEDCGYGLIFHCMTEYEANVCAAPLHALSPD